MGGIFKFDLQYIILKAKIENDTYNVYSEFTKGLLKITITNNNTGWISEKINREHLNAAAQLHQMEYEKYCKQLIDFLKGTESDVEFKIQDNSFIILRKLKDKVSSKFFQCILTQENNVSCLHNVTNRVIENNMSLIQQLNRTKGENQNYKSQFVEYENKFAELLSRMKADEERMLQNFVSLLNEKKRKIQHLTELLDAFREKPLLAEPVVILKKNKRKKIEDNIKPEAENEPVKELMSEDNESSESDTQYETDEEIDDQTEKKVISECNVTDVDPQPSTSSIIDDIFNDSPSKTFSLPKLPKIESKPVSLKSEPDVKIGRDDPATSCSIVSEENNPSKNEENNASKTGENPEKAKKAVVDFDTQDLLDLI